MYFQAQEIQHNYCNASAGLGKYDYNGFCINGTTLMLTLTENSLSLTNTINFENNRLYYFASKYGYSVHVYGGYTILSAE